MMYNSKMAVAIKADGKVLRENKDTVYIPFSSEYSVLLKNLNTVRAIVNVFIDGENVVPGGIVLNAGQEVDLERSIKNGNLREGNRFKFIERTANIEQHRGVKLEDGIVRVEFQFEKVYTRQDGWVSKGGWHPGGYLGHDYYMGSPQTSAVPDPLYNVGGVMRSIDSSKGDAVRSAASEMTAIYCANNNIVNKADCHDGMAAMDCSFNDAGITVPGSKSEQKFSVTGWFPTEAEKHSIVLKLLGETPDKVVIKQPITVKHQVKCDTCGRRNKATAKYCAECGTSLVLYA